MRGGSLAVSLSSWSIESVLLIATAVSYGIRWIAAKQKYVVHPFVLSTVTVSDTIQQHHILSSGLSIHRVRFTLELHALFDLLSIVSHFAINFQTIAEGDQFRRSWLDFGFLRSYIAYVVVDHLFAHYQHKTTFFAQVLLVVFKALCLVFVAACVLFSLERLGDIPYTDSFLLHVYKCSSADGSKTILLKDARGTDAYPKCAETWSFFSSIYFMFVTVSTVGYGDFSPKTVLGQLMVCVIIVFGIYTFANESAAFMTLYGDQRSGRVKYNVSRNTAHVVVTGNPSAAQMKDFIREFFHPDHEELFQISSGDLDGNEEAPQQRPRDSPDDWTIEDGRVPEHRSPPRPNEATAPPSSESGVLATKWLRRRGANRVRETHIVVLMRFDKDDAQSSFQRDVTEYVRSNARYHKRVFLIYGSPLRKQDLERAKLQQAMAVFFLPNKFSNDGNQEDAATVLRVLAVTQQMAHYTQLFAMLVNSENRTLLEATGMKSEHLVCADELRLGLMGLSCRCPGLSTLVSNLITSRSGDVPDATGETPAPWIAEYVAGAANEIYSCALAPHFIGLTFTAATQRIHAESRGLVLLIAVEADGEIAFNPGRRFHITSACKAYLIAESMRSLAPFSSTASLHNAPDGALGANLAMVRARSNLVHRARRAKHNVARRIPTHVREYIRQCSASGGVFSAAQAPMAPPPALLAHGGHIVVCSNVASEGGGQRSVSRLVNFLRPLRAPHIERVVPVVLVDSEKFDGISWLQLSQFGEVYQVQGSPQRHSVLLAAGVYSASAIVVLAQGTEAGYDDSKAIFNAILVNSALQHSAIFTIIELRDVHNNKFLDPVASFSSRRYDDMDDVGSERLSAMDGGRASSPFGRELHGGAHRMSHDYRASLGTSLGGGSAALRESRAHRQSSTAGVSAPRHLSWLEKQTIVARTVLLNVRTFFLGNLVSRVNAFQRADAAAASAAAAIADDDDDTFFQERFMRGALFPSYVADDLLIQSFFNPSLNVFIRKILDGKSCFMLYDIPQQWRHAPLSYGTLFSHMTSGIAHALPIGLLRARDGATGAPCPYVYTCPASSTLVYPEDKVFVIIDVQALHRVANKLQRRFRNRRKVEKDPVTLADTVDVAARRASMRMSMNKAL